MEIKKDIKIGIIGKAGRSKRLPESLIKKAEIIGREVAKKKCVLVTGACMGVPDVAAKAATKEGGIVLGYSPAKELKEHLEPPISYPKPAKNEIPIFTGFGKIGRNVLSILGCDGVIIVGGGIGTLNEFSIAYHEGKVIGLLEGENRVIERILDWEEDFKSGTGKEVKTIIIKESDPKKLVEKVIKEIEKRKEEKRREIPITFKNERNKELMGILHLPEKEKPPIVITCHGFQSNKSQKSLIKLARMLRDMGILVFRFDFEGCGDSEGDPKELTIKKEVLDLEVALKTVLSVCDVNSQRVAFVGVSLGAVVASLVAKKVDVKTLVLWSPAFNQKELLKSWYTKEEIQILQKKGVLYKKEKEIGRDYYLENKDKDYSQVFSKLAVPILIIHGTKDEDVPISYSQKLVEKYQNIILKRISGANHKFDDISHQEKLVDLTCQWLKKYL